MQQRGVSEVIGSQVDGGDAEAREEVRKMQPAAREMPEVGHTSRILP